MTAEEARGTGTILDPDRFAMLLRRWILGGFAALSLAVAGASPAPAAAPRFDVFTVTPVPVDATAANATAARDQALAEGQQHAFRLLMERLTVASGANRLPRLSNAQLVNLVQGFEVANERRSGVRYLADYTFHFRPDAVRQLLRQSGIAFAETPSKPLVVLPVLHDGDRAVLWDDPNSWRDAWAGAKLVPGLMPLVKPLGELGDLQAIDAEAAMRGDAAALKAVSQRYDGDDVLVTQATPKSGNAHGVDVTTTRYSPGSPGSEQTWVTSVTANPGESDAEMMARAVADTMMQIEEAWKAANILDFRQGGTLTARVPISALKDWVAVRDRLAGIPAVRGSQLVSLDRGSAMVEIHYVGDPGQLRLALAQHDLELAGNDPDWVLQRRGAVPR